MPAAKKPTNTRKNGHKKKAEEIKEISKAEIIVEEKAKVVEPEPQPEIAPQPEPEEDIYEIMAVKQPNPDSRGRLSREDRKLLRNVLLFQHPDHGGGYPIKTLLVPGPLQRPYYYRDKLAWIGTKHMFDYLFGAPRENLYLMQEAKTKKGDYILLPYEPTPISNKSLTPKRCYHKTDWSHLKEYILYEVMSLEQLIKIGIIAVIIIATLVIFLFAWSSYIKPKPVIPENTTISSQVVK